MSQKLGSILGAMIALEDLHFVLKMVTSLLFLIFVQRSHVTIIGRVMHIV